MQIEYESLARPEHDAMTSPPLRHTVLITNPQGFHFRPKAAVAQSAQGFQCDIRLCWNGQKFNGKSMLELMMLAAEKGHEVTVEAEGPDAAEALEALVAVLSSTPQEDEATGPAPPSATTS
jgi:phosphotransferase system HPr (HPr) family protein